MDEGNAAVVPTPKLRQSADKIFNVYCRFRPLNARERQLGKDEQHAAESGKPLIEIESPQCLSFDGRPYLFDGIYHESCTQAHFFAQTVQTHVQQFIEQAHDLTILTYGQTSSGKTWTIDGSFYDDRENMKGQADEDSDYGILPRILKIICAANHGGTGIKSSIKVAFYEIYCEKIIDLLTTANSSDKKEIKLFEDKQHDRLELRGLTWIHLTRDPNHNPWETIRASLYAARAHRHFAGTAMNAHSSRSHAILDICLCNEAAPSGNGEEKHLRIIDLAGSERLSKTQSSGQVMQEGIRINESLMYLKRLIDLLAEKEEKNGSAKGQDAGRAAGLDYRSTKLTRLLFSAFRSGRSRIILILCCSPSRDNIHETNNTLRFGSSAKRIRTQLKQMQKRNSERKSHLAPGDMAKQQEAVRLEMENKNQLIELYRSKIEKYEMSVAELDKQLQSALQQLEEREPHHDDTAPCLNALPALCLTKSEEAAEPSPAGVDPHTLLRLEQEKQEKKKIERENEALMKRLTLFEQAYDRCRETMKMQEDVIRRNTQDIMEMQNEINFFDKFRRYLIETLNTEE